MSDPLAVSRPLRYWIHQVHVIGYKRRGDHVDRLLSYDRPEIHQATIEVR